MTRKFLLPAGCLLVILVGSGCGKSGKVAAERTRLAVLVKERVERHERYFREDFKTAPEAGSINNQAQATTLGLFKFNPKAPPALAEQQIQFMADFLDYLGMCQRLGNNLKKVPTNTVVIEPLRPFMADLKTLPELLPLKVSQAQAILSLTLGAEKLMRDETKPYEAKHISEFSYEMIECREELAKWFYHYQGLVNVCQLISDGQQFAAAVAFTNAYAKGPRFIAY